MTTTADYSREELQQAIIDEDHRALLRLIDAAGRICTTLPSTDCHCAQCAAPQLAACENQLLGIAQRMQGLMLEHFEREDELMQQLPCSAAFSRHCEEHRNAHVALSGRYNRLAAAMHCENVATRIQDWKSFLLEWAHGHAKKYDAELSRLTLAASGS